MRFRLLILGLLALVVLPTVAAAQTEVLNIHEVFADCEFFEYGGIATTGLDTLWFQDLTATTALDTLYNVDAGIGAADYFPPTSVPTGVNSSGTTVTRTLPVKKVLLFGVGAYGAQAWQNGASAPSGGADGAAYFWPIVGAGSEYATVVTWPDSIHTAGVAAADTVKIFVGYGY